MNETLLHYLITFGLSMMPIGEIRGAILYGVNVAGLPLPWVFLISIIGNMIPIPFIALFIRRIFAWLRTKSKWLDNQVTKMEQKAHEKGKNVQKYKFFGLFIFVSFPLPGTGGWTGALIGAVLNMRLKHMLPSIFVGIVSAGVITAIFSYGLDALFKFV